MFSKINILTSYLGQPLEFLSYENCFSALGYVGPSSTI